MTIWTFDSLLKVFTSYNFKSVSIVKFVGIKEHTLPRTFFFVEERCCKIYDLFKRILRSCELFKKFYQINPICIMPCGIHSFLCSDAIIKIESVNINCYSSHIIMYKKSH